jgi:hypothetical protein
MVASFVTEQRPVASKRIAIFATAIFSMTMLIAGTASACNIPVFRYALERWRSDAVEVIVFHQGEWDNDDRLDAESLYDGSCNVTVSGCDVRGDVDLALRLLWKSVVQSEQETVPYAGPYAVVRSRLRDGKSLVGWHGPVDELRKASIIDSPVRKEIRSRLFGGDAVVWLLIRSGDENADNQLRARLQNKLDSLEQAIEFPDGIGLPGSELYAEVPLLMQFSILEVDPNDPAEAYLLATFRGFGANTYGKDGQGASGLLVPIFGRGRALDVIQGDAFDEDLVEGLSRYLCAACSCQVKEQNPGFDLLMQVDWDQQLFGESGEVPTPSSGAKRDRPQAPVQLLIPPGRKSVP